MSVRAKFYVANKSESVGSQDNFYQVELKAVYENKGENGNSVEENKIFGRWTPSASLQMTLLDKNAADQFQVGKQYYIDFTLAE